MRGFSISREKTREAHCKLLTREKENKKGMKGAESLELPYHEAIDKAYFKPIKLTRTACVCCPF
jgi:hypothetical protein